ncbi:MAG: hypothetical protein ACK5LS_13665 [Propioniciclava sp.]
MNASTHRPGWATVLALLLVPALLAGGFLWGTWRSDDRLGEVRAGIVNGDEGVTINGQPMPLGRQLAAGIVDTEREQNITWVLANTDAASTGLGDGTYAAVVTIPENLSTAATSFAKPVAEAGQATLTVETSAIIGINETALGQAITFAAVNSLNEFLAQEYLTNVYLAFNDQSVAMADLVSGTRELADGAIELADGSAASASGARELADGLQTASLGGTELRSGSQASASGARELTTGATALADGANSWVSGARAYGTGADTFASGMTDYADGAHTFASGAGTYADGVGEYAGGINATVTPVLHAIQVLPEWGDWRPASGRRSVMLPTSPRWSTRPHRRSPASGPSSRPSRGSRRPPTPRRPRSPQRPRRPEPMPMVGRVAPHRTPTTRRCVRPTALAPRRPEGRSRPAWTPTPSLRR